MAHVTDGALFVHLRVICGGCGDTRERVVEFDGSKPAGFECPECGPLGVTVAATSALAPTSRRAARRAARRRRPTTVTGTPRPPD